MVIFHSYVNLPEGSTPASETPNHRNSASSGAPSADPVDHPCRRWHPPFQALVHEENSLRVKPLVGGWSMLKLYLLLFLWKKWSSPLGWYYCLFPTYWKITNVPNQQPVREMYRGIDWEKWGDHWIWMELWWARETLFVAPTGSTLNRTYFYLVDHPTNRKSVITLVVSGLSLLIPLKSLGI